MRKAKIIAIEGIDGAGKTTISSLVKEKLEKKGKEVYLFKEPGSTFLGEKVREIFKTQELDPLTRVFLIESSRTRLFIEKIFPIIDKDIFIILDRFIYSTIAYQGYAEGLDIEFINLLNEKATSLSLSGGIQEGTSISNDECIKPDFVFLIDISVEKALERIKEKDIFEKKDYLQKVREGFLDLAKKEPIIVLDGILEPSLNADIIISNILK